jgi:hypothetical protein
MKKFLKFSACAIALMATNLGTAATFMPAGQFYLNMDNPNGVIINELTTEWGLYDIGATGTTAPYYYPISSAPYAKLPNGTSLYAYPAVTSPGLGAGWQYSPDLQVYGVPSTAKAVLINIKVKAKAQNVAPYTRTNLGQIQMSVASPNNTLPTNEVIHAHAEKAANSSTLDARSNISEDINSISVPVGVAMVNSQLVFKLYTSVVGTENATINRVVYIVGYWQ